MSGDSSYNYYRTILEGRTFRNISDAVAATWMSRSGFFRMVEIWTQDRGVRVIIDESGVRILFDAPPDGELTTTQLAERTGLTTRRIRQFAPDLVERGLASQGPIRSAWLFRPEAVDVVMAQKMKQGT